MKNPLNSAFFALILSIRFSNLIISDEPTESEVLEEVVVVGIKASLKDAIAIKRSNVGVVEAITAEDFG